MDGEPGHEDRGQQLPDDRVRGPLERQQELELLDVDVRARDALLELDAGVGVGLEALVDGVDDDVADGDGVGEGNAEGGQPGGEGLAEFFFFFFLLRFKWGGK